MLKVINLSLSSICGADCIFCPADRGQRIKQKIMPFKYVEKIINELSSEEFKKHYNIIKISTGENGDSFLNRDLVKILRLIKFKLPQIKIVFATNFQNFTEDKIEIILNEKLIDELSCDIDSFDKKVYYQIKKLDFYNTMSNLMDFLKIRKKTNYHLPLNINIVPYNDYIRAIHYNLGVKPIKIKKYIKTTENFSDIESILKKIINPTDKINRLGVRGWAEREQVKKVNYKKYVCKEIKRIKNEAFIAPDGTWYACCWDSNNELVLGNVMKQSINEIFYSEKRKRFIQMLENKEFEKIGGPCKTVNCCQRFKKSDLETIWQIFLNFITKIKNILN